MFYPGVASAQTNQSCRISGLSYKDGKRTSVIWPLEVGDTPDGPRDQGSAVDSDGKKVFPIHVERGPYAGSDLYTETTPDEFKKLARLPECREGGSTGNATAASGTPALSWEIRDETDRMTGKVTRKAVSERGLGGDIELVAHASCGPLGVEFLFDMFHGRDPAPFASDDDAIAMRIRIDGGAVRTAGAKAEYTNEAKIGFWYDSDPSASRQGGPKDALTDALGAALLTSMMGEGVSGGKLAELAGARSALVELPLANGNAYVVDLNPGDQALGGIMRQCATDLQAQARSTPGRQR